MPAPRPLCAPILAALTAAGLSGCAPQPVDSGRPLEVSVIGGAPRLLDPDRVAIDAPSAALLTATAQGLVRFDAAGQIEPGLAIRWDVSNDGLFYTFRLADGTGIDAAEAARRLRAAAAPASRNPLSPVLGAVAEIVAVTPQVIELRLAAPRPDFLQLLAQPALAIVARGRGSGPLNVVEAQGGALLLAPVQPRDTDPPPAAQRLAQEVRLRGERAARGIVRFVARDAAVVTGGTFADFPIVGVASLPPRALRIDPADGLFGLRVLATSGPLIAPEIRAALAMAIDRDALTGAFAVPGGWAPATALVPVPTSEVPNPTPAQWAPLDVATRRARARTAIAFWFAANPQAARAPLRVALPPGPGARLLLARLRSDWRAVGIEVAAAPADAHDADLALVDQVAPGGSASWYLRQFECVRSRVCSALADQALTAARTARALPERAALLAEADRRLAQVVPYIPLARPLRWSLVAPGVEAWRDNPLAVHPLAHLRD